MVWGGGETLVDPLPMSFTWGVPTTCYQVGFAVMLQKKEKKNPKPFPSHSCNGRGKSQEGAHYPKHWCKIMWIAALPSNLVTREKQEVHSAYY